MRNSHSQAVTVQATFDNYTEAEIACALLSDGSLRPEEPEAVGLRCWLVQVRGIAPNLARRAQVVLRSSGASETQIVHKDQQIEPEFQALPGDSVGPTGMLSA
jgi:hypothetical protein